MKLDLVISFDDTGSMSSVRREVRRRINDVVAFLFTHVPEIRISIIIHNDYCDSDLIQTLDFTSDQELIKNFVNAHSSCGGGDWEEAYGFVLNSMRKLNWQGDKRIAIMIGDAAPHEKGSYTKHYYQGSYRETLDWKEEVNHLAMTGINIYSIQALGVKQANYFWDGIARMSNGVKLELSQFAHTNEFIMAIIHRVTETLDDFQNSNSAFRSNLSLANMFDTLRGVDSSVTEKYKTRVMSEDLSKFQVADVLDKTVIREFVESMGLSFKTGKGYYQLVKSEIIQANKSVLFEDKLTGEVIMNTKKCRDMLGLPLGTKGRVSPRKIECAEKYNIFVQSTSYTRKLDEGTKFLYELEKK